MPASVSQRRSSWSRAAWCKGWPSAASGVAPCSSPPHKRGFYGSMVQIGFPLGMSLGTASFFALAYLDDKQFMSWGWRIPFVASSILVAIGLFIRLRIDETPDFKRTVLEGNISRVPALETIR